MCVHAEGGKQQAGHGSFEGLPGDHLDGAPGDGETGIVVMPERAERGELGQAVQAGDHFLQRICAPAEVVEIIAGPAAGVGEQVAQRQARGGVFIRQAQPGQVGAHGAVQLQPALLDQAQHAGGEHGLGDRADLEEGGGGDGQRVVHAGHAQGGSHFLPLIPDPDGHPRHVQRAHAQVDFLAELIERIMITTSVFFF